MFDGVSRPTARGLWMLAIAIVAVEIAFAAMLVWANTVAEQVHGQRIEQVALADAGMARPGDLADDAFRAVSLPAQDCCATTPLVARIILPPEAMQLADPALLIVSVHDNMLVYIDGQLAAGPGAQDNVSLTGRRPHLAEGRPGRARRGRPGHGRHDQRLLDPGPAARQQPGHVRRHLRLHHLHRHPERALGR